MYGRIFAFGGKIYALLWSLSAHVANVFQSSDSGVTWVALDSGNAAAARFNPAWFFDGAHTVTVAYTKDAGAPAAVFLKSFDLSTGLWGAEFGTVSPPMITRPTVFYPRPDGTYFLLDTATGPPGVGLSGMTAYIYTVLSNTWGAPIDAGANMAALSGFDGTKVFANNFSSYLDTDGTIGLFWHTAGAAPPIHWNNRCFYQQFTTSNSLGAFEDFPGQTTSPQDLHVNTGSPLGAPVLIDAQNLIVLPVARTIPTDTSHAYPTIYVGTPISNPVWTELTSTAGIDAALQGASPPGTIDDSLLVEAPLFAFFDGTRILVSWSIPDSTGTIPFFRLRSAQTSNLVDPTMGWSNSTYFDLGTDAPSLESLWSGLWPQISNFTISAGNILIGVDGYAPATTTEARFSMFSGDIE